MRGDKFASGAARSGVLPMQPIKFNEGEMQDDFKRLSPEMFMIKYMITQIEYDLMKSGGEERVSSFALDMQQRAEAVDRASALDDIEDSKLKRSCDFLEPFHPVGLSGRVLVGYDIPFENRRKSPLLIPKKLRTERTLLPTTGHVLRAAIWSEIAQDWVSDSWLGRRVLFNQMSGSAICFTGFPTWNMLELSEILAIVTKEDYQVVEEPLEPMV